MQGVTTAIVLFIFAAIAYPHLVRNRPQFYGALACILLVIFFDALGHMIANVSFAVFVYVVVAALQIGAIILLVLGTGGMTARELAGDMAKTIDVVRRGGEKETIIVPLTGEQPKARRERSEPPAAKDEDTSIPLE